MPLDATHFYVKGPVNSADLRQFYDLFTGAMSDQPVTFVNTLSVGGSQGVTTVPFRIFGAPGQNTNLIDLYPDRTSAQPSFGFSAVGQFAWGPGATSPQDTFLSRIAMQHGHAGADSAGLLITPQLEVAGYVYADGDVVVDHLGAGAGTALSPGLHFGTSLSGEGIGSQRTAGGAGNQFGLDLWAGGFRRLFISQAGAVTIPNALSIGTTLTVLGDIYSKYLHTNDSSNGIVMADAGSLYLRSASQVVVIDGTGGLLTTRTTYNVNSYYWEGIAGYPILHTNGSIQLDGNTCYFEGSRQVYITYRPDLGALYIPYGNGIFTTTVMATRHDWEASRAVYFNWDGTNITMNMAGSWGFRAPSLGVTNVIYMGTDNVASIQRLSPPNVGDSICLLGKTTYVEGLVIGSAANPTVTWYSPNDPQGGGQIYRVISASTRPAAQVGGGEFHVAIRLFVDGDITSGTNMHAVSFMTTSDPRLKSNAVIMPDIDCMTTVRKNVPVYKYTITPDVDDGFPTPTPNDIGFMADDVYAAVPEFAALDYQGAPVSVVYGQMAAMLWGALRDLDARCVAKGI